MPRYGLYNDKNPLAMSFIPTAKGLVFTIIVYQKLFKLECQTLISRDNMH